MVVDDEQEVLEALRRVLRGSYDVVGVQGGDAAIARLREDGDFAVVVSDLQMPGTDGTAVLDAARRYAPDATRMLLTGSDDVASAAEAVNAGQVFRFLLKPCQLPKLQAALEAAVGQHRLVTAERGQLEQTVRGSIKALLEVLKLVHPQALGRATRVRRHAALLAERAAGGHQWPVEVAALLAHVGAVSLPGDVLDRLHAGAPLSAEEATVAHHLPVIGAQVVAGIPRLTEVHDILLFQRTHFDGTTSPRAEVRGTEIPFGARVLKIADDYEALEASGTPAADALELMANRPGWYDPGLLALLGEVVGDGRATDAVTGAPPAEVRPRPAAPAQPADPTDPTDPTEHAAPDTTAGSAPPAIGTAAIPLRPVAPGGRPRVWPRAADWASPSALEVRRPRISVSA